MRQDRECWYCGFPENVRAVELHHVEKRSTSPDKIKDKTNLVLLCWACHRRTETSEEFYRLIQRLWRQHQPQK